MIHEKIPKREGSALPKHAHARVRGSGVHKGDRKINSSKAPSSKQRRAVTLDASLRTKLCKRVARQMQKSQQNHFGRLAATRNCSTQCESTAYVTESDTLVYVNVSMNLSPCTREAYTNLQMQISLAANSSICSNDCVLTSLPRLR